MSITWIALLTLGAHLMLAVAGCSEHSTSQRAGTRASSVQAVATDSEKVLNVYNWADYIAPRVVSEFEKEYGIRVNYDVYDANEVLETKLLAGHSGYDLVVPSAPFFARQVRIGVFQKLDRARVPNLKYLDPEVVEFLQRYDPSNNFGVVYTWLDSSGLSFDAAKIKARFADAPTDSWRILFDPAILAKFQDCGVAIVESPLDVIGAALLYLGKDPRNESAADLKAAERVLLRVRRYIRYIGTDRYINDFATGEFCLGLGWSGGVLQSRDRAREAGKPLELVFSIPKEGSFNDADVLAIPADAPHPRNAHLFLNYLLRPSIEARNTNSFKFANGVSSSAPLLDEAVRNDPIIYPPPEVWAKLIAAPSYSQDYTRLLMRTWRRFKTGT